MSLIASAIKGVFQAASWLYDAFVDRTRIVIILPVLASGKTDGMAVDKDSENSGRLGIAIGTKHKNSVTLVRVALKFGAGISVRAKGPFTVETNQRMDEQKPFEVVWEGEAPLAYNLAQGLLYLVTFNEGVERREVTLSVAARRDRLGFGRFRKQGKIQEISIHFPIYLTTGVRGLPLPAQTGMGFLNSAISGMDVSGEKAGVLSLHTITETGVAKSHVVPTRGENEPIKILFKSDPPQK
jgi:hypothetical protein